MGFSSKNTGVGCYALLQGIFPTQGLNLDSLVSPALAGRFFTTSASCESQSVVNDSLWHHGLPSPWNSPGQNTGVDSLSLLQGIFPTQESNPGLLHCRQILYWLSHRTSPRTLEQVAYPFSRASSWPRNRTGVSCIAGGFFTNWAIRETPPEKPQFSCWWTIITRSLLHFPK